MLKRLIYLMIIPILLSNISYSKEIYTLNRAVNEALKNNYTIKEAVLNQKAALDSYRSSSASMLPKVNFSYSYTKLKYYPYSIANGAQMKVGGRTHSHWDITITQPIFMGFALITKKEMAKLGVDIDRLMRKKAILDVAENVKIAYFNILLAKKYLDVANEEVKNLKAHAKKAKDLYDVGVIAYNDLLKSQVALSNAIQNRVKAINNLKIAISSFNIALRKNINADTDVVDIFHIEHKHFKLEQLMKEALQKRPQLKALNRTLKKSYLGVRLAKSEFYPHIAAYAKYERNGDNVFVTRNSYSNEHNSMLGIQINWTLFEFGKRCYDTQQQEHKTLALKEKIKALKDAIKLEVKNAYLNLTAAKQNIVTARKALKQAKENFRIVTLQYQQQITTSTEVLDARSYLTQAETNYYNALYGYYISLAKLQRAIGNK